MKQFVWTTLGIFGGIVAFLLVAGLLIKISNWLEAHCPVILVGLVLLGVSAAIAAMARAPGGSSEIDSGWSGPGTG